ncbi:hypothetical protein DITRI_Ditri01bG0192300 [Diplodiscus trichospermus]
MGKANCSSLSIFLAFFLFLSIVVKVVRKATISYSIIKHPPRQRPTSAGWLTTSSHPERPANQHGTLMHLQLGETPSAIVSSKIAEEVLVTQGIAFAQGPFALARTVDRLLVEAYLSSAWTNGASQSLKISLVGEVRLHQQLWTRQCQRC